MSVQFSVNVRHEAQPSETIIAAFSNPGMAGVTATEYLISQLGFRQQGYITVEQLPSIAPFQDGRPYHHTRFFSREDLDITVLASELPVPLQATGAFGHRILEWVLDHDVSEATILTGAPSVHDDEAAEELETHPGEGADVPTSDDLDDVFFVASDDYREHRLADSPLRPMSGGFLNGTHASLISQAIDTPLRAGILFTPTQAQPVASDAALRLVTSLNRLYDIDIDTSELEAFAAEMARYYAELSERVQQENVPEDRMDM